MNKISVSFDLTSSDYTIPLGFELLLDNAVLFSVDHVTEATLVNLEINDDEGEHEFKFVMKNKTQEHTVVDDAGNIVTNAMLSIANVTFDEIKLGHTFVKHTVYHHDFNGAQDPIEDKFFGDMGCNGHVSLKFTTPIYLWLLENI
jgi:hypothetical protein